MTTAAKAPLGILFQGLPDSGKVSVNVNAANKVDVYYPNRVILTEGNARKLVARARNVWLPPSKPLELRGVPWFVNMMADADEYLRSLLLLDRNFGTRVPAFNHPRAVAMSRRDLSARRLEGIAGLQVPACVRFRPENAGDFEKTFAANGFRYPVIVRPATSQSQQGLFKVDSPFDWPQAYRRNWWGQDFYMTQFVDFAMAPGRYVKLRVAFVGQEMFLRGWNETGDWLIHTAYSDEGDNAGLHRYMAREAEFPRMTALRQICAAIRDRVALDFFGVDLGMLSPERFVLFEANAAMSILKPTTGGADASIIKPVQDRIEAAVDRLLASPAAWQSGRAFADQPVETILGQPQTAFAVA